MNFYVTGGSLRSDAPSYVERQADADLLAALLGGEFCYVLTARQMGKSSLMVRAASRLREAGVRVAALDLTSIGGQNVSAEQWYHGLLDTLGQELDLEDELETFWRAHLHLGPLHRLMKALRQVVLEHLQEQAKNLAAYATGSDSENQTLLVIFIDELDFVRSLPFPTDEFFAAIRECYNRRTRDPLYQRVTFCLLGVAAPSDLIRDSRTTPFNIGRRIELNDFTIQEAAPLVQGLRPDGSPGAEAHAVALLHRILFWTHGHPYLTQRLCHSLTLKEAPLVLDIVDETCRDLFLSHRARERDDNLIFVRERLLRDETESVRLLTLYRTVLEGRRAIVDDETDPQVASLRLSGIVRSEAGRLRVRNRVYEEAFNGQWIEAHLPEAELRRQREAFLRGVRRTAAVAAVVILLLATMLVLVLQSQGQARDAAWTALRQQAHLQRISGLAGQQREALASLRQAARIRMAPELRDEAIACLALPELGKEFTAQPQLAEAIACTWSDDLTLNAAALPSGEVVVQKAHNKQELARWTTGLGSPEQLWLSPGNEFLGLVAPQNGKQVLTVWRWTTRTVLCSVTNQTQAPPFTFAPNARKLAVGDERGQLRILNLPDGDAPVHLAVEEPCSLLRFTPDGRRIAVGSTSSLSIGVYDTRSGALLHNLHSPSPPVGLEWHPSGDFLAAAGDDARLRLWELGTGEFAKVETPRQPGGLAAVAFNHQGSLLATAGLDRTIRLWDIRGHSLLTTTGPADVRQLRFSPNDRQLILERGDGRVLVSDVARGDVCRTLFESEAEDLIAVAVHPSGRFLATAHLNGITFWDGVTGTRLDRMQIGSASALAFHSVSGDLVDAEFRGTYSFRIECQDDKTASFRVHPREDFYLGPGAVAIDLAADSDLLAVAYDDRVRLTKLTNSAYAILAEFIGVPGFRSIVLSPSGDQIVAANWKTGDLWLWNSREPSKVARRIPVGGPAHVALSRDGHWLATGTAAAVSIWDTHSWQAARQEARPPGATRPAPVAFSGQGSILAVAWKDEVVRLLKTNGDIVADLETPSGETLTSLSFSADASQLACGTTARSVLWWDLHAVSEQLRELGFTADFPTFARPNQRAPRVQLQVGGLDRLRFSQPKQMLRLRRDIAELDERIQQSPTTWYFYQYRAEKYQQLGEYQKAVDDYERWIELDQTAADRGPGEKAWPYRDLARLYLDAPEAVRNYAKAADLTSQALALDPDNPDNHFRYGVACYRLRRYQEAAKHFESARRRWESARQNTTAALLYEAMCSAHARQATAASQFLYQAKQAYAATDLHFRESHANELSNLIWEAEQIVAQRGG